MLIMQLLRSCYGFCYVLLDFDKKVDYQQVHLIVPDVWKKEAA